MKVVEAIFWVLALILLFTVGFIAESYGSVAVIPATFACICMVFMTEAKRDGV